MYTWVQCQLILHRLGQTDPKEANSVDHWFGSDCYLIDTSQELTKMQFSGLTVNAGAWPWNCNASQVLLWEVFRSGIHYITRHCQSWNPPYSCQNITSSLSFPFTCLLVSYLSCVTYILFVWKLICCKGKRYLNLSEWLIGMLSCWFKKKCSELILGRP